MRERSEQANSQLVKNLYSIHFNQPTEHEPPISPRSLNQMQEDSKSPTLDRKLTVLPFPTQKTILLFTLYRNLGHLP